MTQAPITAEDRNNPLLQWLNARWIEEHQQQLALEANARKARRKAWDRHEDNKLRLHQLFTLVRMVYGTQDAPPIAE